MSEMFGGLMAAPEDEVEQPSRSRRTLVLGAGLAAAALLGGGYLVLGAGGGGGDSATSSAATTVVDRAVTRVRPSASPSASPQVPAVPETVDVSLAGAGRNPFRALVAAGGGSAASSTTATSTGTSTSTSNPSTTDSDTGVPPGSSSIPTAVPTSAPATTPSTVDPTPTTGASTYALKLVSISAPQPQARVATFSVAGKQVQVLTAQRFGQSGELVVLAWALGSDGSSIVGAVLQVGAADPVRVAIGSTLQVA